MSFKPLLAAPVEFEHLDYSNTWVSAKLDGIRAIVLNGVVVSRNLKPIPNKYVQHVLGNRPELEGYDGELIVGDPTAKGTYRATNSGVMAVDGEPAVNFFAFDHIECPNDEYHQRYSRLQNLQRVVKVEQKPVIDHDHLLDIEQFFLGMGFEGIMLRAIVGPASRYKYGRSTAKQGTLLKLKRFTDREARVVGVEELMKNGNEKMTNALGYAERSSHQENLIPVGVLGALVCETDDGIVFKIGTGFDAATRQDLWNIREKLPGQFTKYKSFDIGVKEAPRFPVFLGLRDPIDM